MYIILSSLEDYLIYFSSVFNMLYNTFSYHMFATNTINFTRFDMKQTRTSGGALQVGMPGTGPPSLVFGPPRFLAHSFSLAHSPFLD